MQSQKDGKNGMGFYSLGQGLISTGITGSHMILVWFTCKPGVRSTDSATSGRDTWSGQQHAPSPAHPLTPRCSMSKTCNSHTGH